METQGRALSGQWQGPVGGEAQGRGIPTAGLVTDRAEPSCSGPHSCLGGVTEPARSAPTGPVSAHPVLPLGLQALLGTGRSHTHVGAHRCLLLAQPHLRDAGPAKAYSSPGSCLYG